MNPLVGGALSCTRWLTDLNLSVHGSSTHYMIHEARHSGASAGSQLQGPQVGSIVESLRPRFHT